MKICLINNLYKPFNRGGAERVVELIAKGLRQNGHEVFIIATKPGSSKKPVNNQEKIYWLNSLYFYLDKLPKFFRLFLHILFLINLIKYFKIKYILNKEQPDLVISNNLLGLGLIINLAIKNLKIQHLHILHDIQLLHPSGLMFYEQEKIINSIWAKIYQYINKNLFNKNIIIVSPSRWLMDLHLQKRFFLSNKYKIIPNPVVATIAKNNLANKDSKIFKILYIGHISHPKGAYFLVSSFKQLLKFLPNHNFELTMAGRGSEKGNFNLGNKLKMAGWLSKEAVRKLLYQTDCLVMPSLCYENSPTVIYEAVSLGVPVIASRIGGAKELVEKLGGLLFTPGDEEDLIKKISWAVKNRSKLKDISLTGFDKIKLFNLESYIKNLLELLK